MQILFYFYIVNNNKIIFKMYMPKPVNYYLYHKILDSSNNRLNRKTIKQAVINFGFEEVYNTGYITNLKLFSKVDKKTIINSNLFSERTINYIYEK